MKGSVLFGDASFIAKKTVARQKSSGLLSEVVRRRNDPPFRQVAELVEALAEGGAQKEGKTSIQAGKFIP